MPYCAVYGCTNDSKKHKGISFFRFPKDSVRRKAWIHYCKRVNFEPTEHSRICHKHFSDSQLARNPVKMQEYGYHGARIQVKDDAVPDIPYEIQGKDGAEHNSAVKPRGAYEKRRKLEILEGAMGDRSLHHEEIDVPTEMETELPSTSSAPRSCSTDTDDLVNSTHQKTQTDPQNVKTKTRRLQTRGVSVQNVGTQCELLKPPEREPVISPIREGMSVDNFEHPMTSTVVYDDESEDILNTSFESSIGNDNDEDLDPNFDPDTDFTETSEDEDSSDELLQNYKLEKTESPLDEKYYLVSESSLTELLAMCRRCGKECTSFIEYTKGSMICTSSVCESGHITKWLSQSTQNKLPWGNLLIASAIVLSGSNTSKVLRLFEHMKVQMISQRTAARLQSAYTIPATLEEFDSKQADLLQTLRGTDLVLGGDGRCDSPGYSAKFGCYTLMDLSTSKILDVRLVQSNEVKGPTHMELEGLKRGLEYLTGIGQQTVRGLVTDRHVMIKKYMRENQPNIKHYFDVWHIAKGVTKKLEAAAKKRAGHEIRPWIRSISNHTYWVAATSGDNEEMKLAKWKSVLNHIRDIHEHDSDVFPECEHEEFDMEEDKAWLRDGSRCFKLIQEVVESPYLLRDIPKLSPDHQTYGLEVYHSVLNQFAPKSTHFFYASMMARTYVAALHFNENGNRDQATTKEGEGRWRTSFPRAKKGEQCVVKAQRIPATYEYVHDLLKRIFHRRTALHSILEASEDFRLGFDKPAPLTSAFENPGKATLVRERTTRFN